jgi:hypothetical protein
MLATQCCLAPPPSPLFPPKSIVDTMYKCAPPPSPYSLPSTPAPTRPMSILTCV